VAAFDLSDKQLEKLHWYKDIKDVSSSERALLQVNVYLDFSHADVPISSQGGKYQQTGMRQGYIYRAVAYIPVLVWLGAKPSDAPSSNQPSSDDAPPAKPPVQLSPPQRMAFAQYGVLQTLPLSPGTFQSLTWAITFLDNGEATSASFVSKSSGVNASAFLGTAASTANSIATEQRAAASPSNEALQLQGQADLIYQTRRLALCQSEPASCPSK